MLRPYEEWRGDGLRPLGVPQNYLALPLVAANASHL
jgi:hypothetical protein